MILNFFNSIPPILLKAVGSLAGRHWFRRETDLRALETGLKSFVDLFPTIIIISRGISELIYDRSEKNSSQYFLHEQNYVNGSESLMITCL